MSIAVMRDGEVVTPTMQVCHDLAWRICCRVGQNAEGISAWELPRDTLCCSS